MRADTVDKARVHKYSGASPPAIVEVGGNDFYESAVVCARASTYAHGRDDSSVGRWFVHGTLSTGTNPSYLSTGSLLGLFHRTRGCLASRALVRSLFSH